MGSINNYSKEKINKGPFIFYEIGGAGGIDGGGAMQKKLALKGGPAQKILSVTGVTQKITLKCCNNSAKLVQNFLPKCPKIAFLRF